MASETQAEAGSTAIALQPPSDVAAVRSDVVHLRSFPVVYRWNMGRSSQSGTVNGVKYQQTMGRMVLMYPLEGNVDEDDLKVEMSCWQLKVSKSGSQIPALCQETFDDIHRDISWWKVEAPNENSNERFLIIYLAKANHRPWTSPWFDGPLNHHKKQLFSWHELQGSRDVLKGLKIDSESLKTIEPGEPEDWNHEISTAMTPEQICTGIDIMESENMVTLMIHLNEEALDGATARLPLEEVFAADVSSSEVWVFLRGDSFTLCNGRFAHPVRPAQSSWQIRSVRRKSLPEGCNVKAPAFYNPALLISLVKESIGTWDKVFQEFHHCNYGMPRDRIEWSERVQRCMVLLPGAPNNKVGKASRAQALVKRVEATQHSLLNRIIILFHLEDKLAKLCESHRVSMHDLFTLMIGERSVQLNFVADSEYAMCWGGLGGACIPHSASMEIFMDKDGEEPHPVLKLGLAKAENSKGKWEEVFKQMQPWQLSRALLEDCQRPPELALEDDD